MLHTFWEDGNQNARPSKDLFLKEGIKSQTKKRSKICSSTGTQTAKTIYQSILLLLIASSFTLPLKVKLLVTQEV